MKAKFFMLLIGAVILGGCASTLSSTWTKSDYQGRKYDKILVLVESNSLQSRINSENIIVDQLIKEGINAANSLEVFPVGTDVNSLSEEDIEKRILDGGYDGVLISLLATSNTRDVREGGGTYAQPVTVRYGRRIRTGYVHVQEPEYYRQQTTFVLETQLYDTKDQANKQSVVWSGQSEVIDPSSVDSAVKSHAKALVNSLLSSGIIQK